TRTARGVRANCALRCQRGGWLDPLGILGRAGGPAAVPLFSYQRMTPPAPVHTRSIFLSPLMSAPTQLFIAFVSSIFLYVHSPVAASAGAKNTWTPPGAAFGLRAPGLLLSLATMSSRPSPFRSTTAISWPLATLS